MTGSPAMLSGLVPDHLKVRSARILLENLEVQADIGFHEFEVGSPQWRLAGALRDETGSAGAGRHPELLTNNCSLEHPCSLC